MLKVELWPSSRDFIDTLSEKHKCQVAAKVFKLTKNPHPPQSKQLGGFAPLRRVRTGEYRIVYFVEKGILRIPLIDRRNDDKVYRRLRNLFK